MAAPCPQEVQDVMACQLCEETQEIKWKCMTCDFLMCMRCCKIHQKVKSTGPDHDVVNIKDIGTYTAEPKTRKEFQKIACTTHDEQICCLFCLDCHVVVCPLCIAGTHNKHHMEEIKKRHEFCVQGLIGIILELDQESRDLEQDVLTLDSTRSVEENKFEMTKHNIQLRDEALKVAVDQYTKKLLYDLDAKWDTVDKSISSQKTEALQRTHNVKEAINNINHTLKSGNIKEVFQEALKHTEKNKTGIQDGRLGNDEVKIPYFVKGEINQCIMEFIHGKLAQENASDKIEFKVEEKYDTVYSDVRNIFSSEDGSIWISYPKMLENITLANGYVTTNRDYQLHINNIALMPNGDLLLSTGKNELRMIPKSTMQIKISHFKLQPGQISAGVHVTKERKILVGALTINESERNGQLIVFSFNGKIERAYSKYHEKKLFTDPFRISTDSSNNIYVIDVIPDEKRRLVILSHQGGVKAIYTGHTMMYSKKAGFADLAVTKSDNVILSDYYNNALHILNNEGQCIAYKTIASVGISSPFSLYIDNRGLLLIGCFGNNANIYVVKFSGC